MFLSPLLRRLAQTFYTQVSAWMIRMESDLSSSSSRDIKQMHKTEVNSRASLFVQVRTYVLCTYSSIYYSSFCVCLCVSSSCVSDKYE